MEPTYIGLMAVLPALMFMNRNMTSMLTLVAGATIFGAASAIDAPALGGASIPPPVFLLAFLVLRLIRSKELLSQNMESALKDSALMGIFVFYGVISAYILPHAFFHQIEVVPNRFDSSNLFFVVPLAPSPQNITQSTYLMGTFLMLVATVFIARTERRSRQVAMAMIFLAWAQVFFAILDLISTATHLPLLDWLRNANYAIVDQEVGGFHRIQGTFPETSAFSAWGFFVLVFVGELWLRGIEPKLTGWTALALGFIMFASTSTSAYIGIAVFCAVLGLRITYFPSTSGQRKALLLVLVVLVVAMLVLAMLALLPGFASNIGEVLVRMTTGKVNSDSGIQRGFWNQKAWECFRFSKGLGVGVGTFRASSLIGAIGGATGVIGITTFVLFCLRVLPVYRYAPYRLDTDKTQAVGAAAGWAAVVGLAPAMFSGTNPDPGLMFAFLAGLAIAWAPYGKREGRAAVPSYNAA